MPLDKDSNAEQQQRHRPPHIERLHGFAPFPGSLRVPTLQFASAGPLGPCGNFGGHRFAMYHVPPIPPLLVWLIPATLSAWVY